MPSPCNLNGVQSDHTRVISSQGDECIACIYWAHIEFSEKRFNMEDPVSCGLVRERECTLFPYRYEKCYVPPQSDLNESSLTVSRVILL